MPAQKTFSQDLTSLAVLVSLENKSFGSGIFVLDSGKVFFATARHVLFLEKIDKEKKRKSFPIRNKKISLLYYPKNQKLTKQETLEVDLEILFKNKALTINSPQDICVFQIADLIDGKLKFIEGVTNTSDSPGMNVASSSMVREFPKIEIGDNLYVIGYPKALGLKNNSQYDFSKPLVRNGIIAGLNDTKQTIIIDCPVFGGNSGGPVFIVEKHMDIVGGKLISTNKKFLIGLVSQFIPWLNKTNKNTTHMENSGFGVVAPFDEIMRLIKLLEKT